MRALARIISLIENEDEKGAIALSILANTGLAGREVGGSRIIGITGAPGVGKSTLTGALALELACRGKKVGVIGVDPSSHFSGGAILGDRLRMAEASRHPNIFIRSMSTRGHLGGLARATRDVIRILSAFGKEYIIVESVGVGQSEVEIIGSVDTAIMVEVPGMGDDIQAIKAGILEAAHILVINKVDRPGAELVERNLKEMLSLRDSKEWIPPVIRVIATEKKGIPELIDAIEEHTRYLEEYGRIKEKRSRGAVAEFETLARNRAIEFIMDKLRKHEQFKELSRLVYDKILMPREAMEYVDVFLESQWGRRN